jgi:hypothetical protein
MIAAENEEEARGDTDDREYDVGPAQVNPMYAPLGRLLG